MLLVFCPKISPRLRYIFHHVFTTSMGIEIDFTTTIDTFIAHNGPKMSYGKSPLGNEFFVESVDLLFEYGLQNTTIEVYDWDGLPVFFGVTKKSKLPFDVFAASFYLLSRYEEYLPHIKDEWGRFLATQSTAYKNNFLDKPLVDFWILRLFKQLKEAFPTLEVNAKAKEQFMPLIDVVSPFKYRHKSFFANLLQWVKALFQLNFWELVEQPLVLFRIRKDPWDTFQFFIEQFSNTRLKFRFFFLFTNESYMDRGISYLNRAFQDKIKTVADYFDTSLLASYSALDSEKKLEVERNSLYTLIHRVVNTTRYAWGIKATGETYRNLVMQEIEGDFSMGYTDHFGYRASTAVPFYFYDLSNEMSTSLKIFSVVSNEHVLRDFGPIEAIKKLKMAKEILPLETGIHAFSLSNSAFERSAANESFRSLMLDYLCTHDQ